VQSGFYDFHVYIASPDGSSIRFKLDGEEITGSMAIPGTGGWQTWNTITKTNIALKSGVHILQLYEENGGFNIDKFVIQRNPNDTTAVNQKDMRIYPNPASSHANIEFETFSAAPVKVELFDLHGRLLESIKESPDSGTNQIEINVKNIASGSYYIKLYSDAGVKTGKLLVIK
jgi:hypothetical protein